ncbi:MAG: PilW family protein [Aquisalimonadaceae bacterium]
MNYQRTDFRPPDHRMTGFSLVEVMVALAIGLVLTLGVVTLTLNTNRTHAELSQASMQIDNGRTAMQILSSEIQLAGFYGEFYDSITPPGTLLDPCHTHLHQLRDSMGLPLQGYDGATDTIPPCVVNAGHIAGTDVLVVRRTMTVETDPASLVSGGIYLQGAPLEWVLDGGTASNFALVDRDGNLIPIRRYRADMYFIGTNDQGDPALRRLEVNEFSSSPTAVTLVDGIENMQIDYGIDRNADGAPDSSSDTANDAYVGRPADVDAWLNVVSLRVHLLTRNLEPTPGHSDDKTYRLGLTAANATQTVGPENDAFKRHVYQSTVRLANISGRRE